MITISLAREKKQLNCCFCGHAGYAPQGSDIVCSAVSALYYTLLHTLKKQNVTAIESCMGDDRTLSIILPSSRSKTHAVNALITAVFDGLTLIAQEYPENVQVFPSPIHI